MQGNFPFFSVTLLYITLLLLRKQRFNVVAVCCGANFTKCIYCEVV